jgi:hypothetical protein
VELGSFQVITGAMVCWYLIAFAKAEKTMAMTAPNPTYQVSHVKVKHIQKTQVNECLC